MSPIFEETVAPIKVYFDHVVLARERIGVIAVRGAGGK